MKPSKSVIIVAGGSGSRMKSDIPKQFLLLNNKPILFYSLEAFHDFDPTIEIVLVLPKNDFEFWKSLCQEYDFRIEYTLAEGGKTRFDSVKNGLEKINQNTLIAVHDGARPLIKKSTISNLFADAEKYGNAVPAISINESVRVIDREKSKIVDRSKLLLIQTPQIFKSEDLKTAYQQNFREEFTDDATVVELLGQNIHISEGHPQNIKITHAHDLKTAEALISN